MGLLDGRDALRGADVALTSATSYSRDAPEVEEARRDLEKAEAFLKSLEEYHRSGLMPERLYLEKRGQSEERLKELKRKLRG